MLLISMFLSYQPLQNTRGIQAFLQSKKRLKYKTNSVLNIVKGIIKDNQKNHSKKVISQLVVPNRLKQAVKIVPTY